MLDADKKIAIFKDMLRVRGFVPFYGFTGIMLQIIFLKYLCNFEDDRMETDDLKLFMKYQRMLMSGDIDFKLINQVYLMMGKIYDDHSGVLNTAIESIERAFAKDSRVLIQVINIIEIPTDKEELTDLLLYIISQGESGDISKTGMNTSNTSLIELTKCILNVKPTDSFIDCFCGFNKTMLSVNAGSYQGYEINHEVAAIAFMTMIMSGKKNFRIFNQDYYSIEHETKYDKVFADGPLSMSMNSEYNVRYGYGKRSDIYNVLLPLSDLREKGKAVLTCAPMPLYSIQKSYIDMRKNVMSDLIAIVSLPPLWSGSSVNTNILVLEKGNSSDNVIFVDATNTGMLNKMNRQYSLSKEKIDKILNSINGEIVEGFSAIVRKEEILSSDDVSLQPSRYVEKKQVVTYRKVTEINQELDKVYAELFKLIKE